MKEGGGEIKIAKNKTNRRLFQSLQLGLFEFTGFSIERLLDYSGFSVPLLEVRRIRGRNAGAGRVLCFV